MPWFTNLIQSIASKNQSGHKIVDVHNSPTIGTYKPGISSIIISDSAN